MEKQEEVIEEKLENTNLDTEEDKTVVNLGDKVVGEIELPVLDISKYVGHMVKIQSVSEHEGNFGYYVKVVTDKLATVEMTIDNVTKDVEITASRIFGLQQTAKGIGWGKDTNMGNFLSKMKCTHYKELVGKVVQVQKKTNKQNKAFLTFD